jgi:hypothetical protein
MSCNRLGSLVIVVVAFAVAWADDLPDSTKQVAAVMSAMRRDCEHKIAEQCVKMGNLADLDYTVLKNDFHHDRDVAQARWAYGRAVELFRPKCGTQDGKACDQIARVYFSNAMRDPAKELVYLEKGCAASYAWSCFDRGQRSGRSKSASVKWYAEGCRLGERSSCDGLPIMVLSSAVLDPVDLAPMDGAALREILENAHGHDDRPLHAHERTLALAVARWWAGDRKGALAELGEADKRVDEQELHILAAHIELRVADGIDRARAGRAWERLVALTPKRDGKYKDQMLESDYAWVDPSDAMKRAEAIAARNR